MGQSEEPLGTHWELTKQVLATHKEHMFFAIFGLG